MATNIDPRGARSASRGPQRRRERCESWVGWIPRDTSRPPGATYRAKENVMILKARSRARVIVESSVELYREMALSAISLVRR